MKRILLFLNVLLISIAFAQQKPIIDTAQIVVPNRVNSQEALSKPYVILISTDGYRSDYTEKYQAQNIKSIGSAGVAAKAMLPSFPSITFPNHWSIITGLYPSHHGIVDNFFYDVKNEESFAMSNPNNAENSFFYGGNPLWSLAESQGVLSASLQWVGSATDAGGYRPTYYYRYHEKFTPTEKVKKVINWLKLPEEQRPHFISLYFPEVDAAGHHFGPNAQQTKEAVGMVDNAIGQLLGDIKKLNLENVQIVFVSDHGMIDVNKDQPLEIPKILLNKDLFRVFNAQTLLRIQVKNKKDIKPTFKHLKKTKTKDYEVFLTKRFPKKLHYGIKDDVFDRIGDIILVPYQPNIFLEKGRKTTSGKHGYDVNVVPEMKAVFYAEGSMFKQNLEIDEFRNVNVYPLIAHLLGLKIQHKIDGDFKVLKPILK